MRKFAYTLVTSLSAGTTQGAPRAGDDCTHTLQESLVIGDEGPRYYRDMRLAANADGSLRIVAVNGTEEHFMPTTESLPAHLRG